ncbi:hypothetical protein H4P12_12430 [Paracoccus sp. 11-3]|uniref:Uncharacterized protein n=1 Tax=Paracoccus amoyensis TaxID=2760093 RepID=A0A926GIB2_9RHOB|nr:MULTISPECIES: hypothetical protein [Paracoccus]MBC9247497.1 hypothetical protein [Paracoccus amoyensis]NHF74870.1 hypothetical protein [Paracoccus xiamenensis]
MTKRSDMSDLMGFIGEKGVWADRMKEVTAEHIRSTLEDFGIDFLSLIEVLGGQWKVALWDCGFEDFLSRHYEDGNIVDHYLTSRNWRDTVRNRDYLTALRDTPISLYEVDEVQPGVSMVLRDVLGPAEPVTVRATDRNLQQGSRIATRLMPKGDHHVIAGALLAFRAEAVKLLFHRLRDALELDTYDLPRLTRDQLMLCAPVFTSAWLFTELDLAEKPVEAVIFNTDGDDVLFHDLRFPLADGVTQKDVAEQLGRVDGFKPDGPNLWNWLRVHKGPVGGSAGGMIMDNEIDGATVMGTLELTERTLIVDVNSAARAAHVDALVTAACGELLTGSITIRRTMDQMRGEYRPIQPLVASDEIPPENTPKVTHEDLDRHYRETLDAPIPALGGKTPRASTRTAVGRAKVVDWLEYLEGGRDRYPDSPVAEYDFGWMWDELGLKELRK